MVLGRVLDLFRGTLAWAFGYGLTLVLLVVDLVDGPGTAWRATADVYLGAHVLPPVGASEDPIVLLAVPVLVVAIAGYDAGRAFRRGVTGRIREAVRSFAGKRRRNLTHAVVAGVLLAVGYAVTTAVVALVAEAALLEPVVGSILAGLVVGLPAALVGAIR